MVSFTESGRGESIVEFTIVKQSMIRDLLEAANELNRANDTYRLAHLSAKMAKTFTAYGHVSSIMVDELEGTYPDVEKQEHPHAAPSLLTGREVLNGD